ncbi:MAG: CDP-diacylglycerol--glycerol-3-phosphate 3-phosphatidyltransferase [Clostridiales bacterium]|jgi:CDP-diacylglycerol--glycerol-3-phosphate 3-phosphatidyltransferase|nr:CDP-diacylglycerol--glycerol-3-phosphate 3-phosphatidyltransferase [Clostridiales bacterium]
MNTPNKLTILRMIITPVFLAVFLLDFPYHILAATIIFCIGSVTDAIDGRLARKNLQVTVFGKLADPVADKMLTTAALLAFMHTGLCNIWIVMIVLTREFAVTSIRLVASAQGIVIPANMWGKLKTVSQMTFTIVILVLYQIHESFNIFPADGTFTLPFVSNLLLWITAVLTVISGIIYVVQSSKLVDFSQK